MIISGIRFVGNAIMGDYNEINEDYDAIMGDYNKINE